MTVGPVGVSNRIEANTPKITERTPINEEKKAIWIGDFESCLAEAAGIISIEVISNIPTIFTQVATKIIKRAKNTACIRSVFTFSALAIFASIVIKTSLFHIKYNIVRTDKVAKINQINSSEVTVKISPNRYESKFTFSFNKLIETIPIDNDEWARIPNNVSIDKILLFWWYIWINFVRI